MSHSPEAYDAWYEKPFGRYADRLEKSLVSKLLPEVTRKLILDMGCGTGNYSIMLARMKAYVVSVDAQLPMVTITKRTIQEAATRHSSCVGRCSCVAFQAWRL